MRTLWIAPIAALVVAFAPLAYAQTKTETKMERSADTGFVQQALKSGQEEAALAKLAAEKSQNAEVKQLAQMLVSDHTQVNEQLQLLAKRNGATPAPRDGSKRSGTDTASPPATAPGAAPSSAKADELAKLSGPEFDKKFLAMIVEGHEKSVELYTAETEKGTNPAAKKLATETLPKIKQHLQQAKSLQQQTMDKKSQ
jgi:putative membrane protein